MNVYVATCSGGPWDGKRLTHHSKELPIVSPFSPFGTQDVVPIVTGTYLLDNFGRWVYRETDAGKALRRLRDEANKG